MGNYSEALLVFGCYLPKTFWRNLDDDDLLEEILVKKHGLGERPSWRTEEGKKYSKVLEKLKKECPIDFKLFSSDEDAEYLVCLNLPTECTTDHYEKVDLAELSGSVTKEKIKAAEKFCAECGIPWENPSWLLAVIEWV